MTSKLACKSHSKRIWIVKKIAGIYTIKIGKFVFVRVDVKLLHFTGFEGLPYYCALATK